MFQISVVSQFSTKIIQFPLKVVKNLIALVEILTYLCNKTGVWQWITNCATWTRSLVWFQCSTCQDLGQYWFSSFSIPLQFQFSFVLIQFWFWIGSGWKSTEQTRNLTGTKPELNWNRNRNWTWKLRGTIRDLVQQLNCSRSIHNNKNSDNELNI